MKTERVNIEDVFPDPKNPRRDFSGIPELAASFALNSERPGEPFQLPVLLQDGGTYHIIDGERRYRAMKRIGTKSFLANVCENMDEASVIMAMLLTDDKQQLTDVERSRGYQAMLQLGVDPEKADKAAKQGKGTAKRVKKAVEQIGVEAENMSIEHIMAAGEFEGDTERFNRIINAKETEYKRVLDACRKEREHKAEMDALIQAAYDKGYPVHDSPLDGYSHYRTIWNAESLPEAKTGSIIVPSKNTGFVSVSIYTDVSYDEPTVERIDPEAQRKTERKEKAAHLLDLMDKTYLAIEQACLSKGKEPTTCISLALDKAFGLGDYIDSGSTAYSNYTDRLLENGLIDDGDETLTQGVTGITAAYFVGAFLPKFPRSNGFYLGDVTASPYIRDRIEQSHFDFQEGLEALKADGYADGPEWDELQALLQEVLDEMGE